MTKPQRTADDLKYLFRTEVDRICPGFAFDDIRIDKMPARHPPKIGC